MHLHSNTASNCNWHQGAGQSGFRAGNHWPAGTLQHVDDSTAGDLASLSSRTVMDLSEQEVAWLRLGFEHIEADAEKAAAIFFERLFDLAPRLRQLFEGDLSRLGRELTGALGVVVAQIQNWDVIAPVVTELVRRHVAHGTKPRHYPIVGLALVGMVADMTPAVFRADVEAVWTRVYAVLSSEMIAAAFTQVHAPFATTDSALMV